MKTLKELRERLAKLQADARAKIDQIKDDTPADQARKIEGEHKDMLAEIERVQAELAEREAEEAARQSAPANHNAPAADRLREEAIAAERKRQKDIRELGARLRLPEEFVARHIDGGATFDAFKAAALDHLADSPSNRSAPHGIPSVEITQDEGETRRRGMVEALTARLARAGGERNVQVPEYARAYAEMGLVEMAAECVGYRGHMRTARQVADLLDRAFARSGFVGHAVSDFPAIFIDAMNRRLLARYQTATPTYRRFAGPYAAIDFRDQNVIRAGDFPSLQPVGENGEIKAGTFSESKEKTKVSAYGVTLNISRVMIVNDNLGAIDQVLASAGMRVADWENVQAFAVLNANPALLTDNTAVFHASHGNLAGVGSAISVTSIGAGRAAMMKQKTLDGIVANFTPAVLLTGPDKQTESEQLLTAITPAQQSNAIPESLRRLAPVADANISGNAWYLFADPQIAPCFVYSLLEGFEGPRLSSQEQFDVQGLKVKLEHDFGVAAIDYRGGFKNAGA